MAYATGASRRVAYVAETAYGQTPATPSFKTLRTTGGGLRTNKSTATSQEVQADRNIRDEILTGMDVTGSYPFEFSYGSFDDILAAALFNNWATNVLKNGTTRQSLTFEEALTVGGVENYRRFMGVMVNSISFDIASRQIVTGTMDLMGVREELDDAAVTGATYAAPASTPVMSSSASVANLNVTGLGANPPTRTLNLQIANNLRNRPLVGNVYSDELGEGMCDVTGTIETYFQSNDLYQKVLDHGSGSISFTLGLASGQKYTFLLPKVIFGNGEVRAGGQSDDVIVSMPIRAVYDSTEQCSIKITRAVA